jgi:uncharacterized membrane protein required for colicin V production
MIIDLVILGFILIMAFSGWRQGFFVILGDLLVMAVSLAATLLVLSPLTKLIAWLPFLQTWSDQLNKRLIYPLLPAAGTLRQAIDSLPLPKVLQQLMLAKFPNPDSRLAQAWPELSSRIFQYALTAVVFVILFILLTLAIRLVMQTITGVLDRIPLLGTLNHLGGLLAGIVQAGLILLVALLILGLVSPYFPNLVQWLQQSSIIRYFYSVNFLYTFMSLFFQKMAT